MATDSTNDPAFCKPVDFARASNEAAFFAQLHPAQLLTLGDGARRVIRDFEHLKRDELWRGEVYDPYAPEAGAIAIYLRVGQPAPLVAELLCALVARALGLPAPEPFVVLIEPGTLAESVLLPQKERMLCIGTRDIGGSTFAQLMREDSATARDMIMAWEHLIPVTALDEWLANPDRNLGNILYVAQTLHIIDHAEAFGGSARELFPLAEITHEAFMNKLAMLLANNSASQRQQTLNAAGEWLTFSAAQVDINALIASADIKRWQSDQEEDELLHFIKTRLTITHRLLCQRLGHPQLELST